MNTVLIAGGAVGIGAAIARCFHNAQWNVICLATPDQHIQAESFVRENCLPVYEWDPTNWAQCQAGIELIHQKHGPIDVLINAYDGYSNLLLTDMTMDQWIHTIHLHLTSLFCMCKSLLDSMKGRVNARIINIGSSCANLGEMGMTHYSTCKAGVVGFTRSLAKEVAPYGMTVNVIAPGYIRPETIDQTQPNVLEKAMQQVPLRRMGSPEEVADLALFLASPRASFITGETFHIDGGQWMNG